MGDVKAAADFVSTKNGGEGAVREFIEYIRRRSR
jgi:3-deoxy-D-manno-octulosonate 8-phosphate phosphatase KdsC-like HAD superfamily phosphatase